MHSSLLLPLEPVVDVNPLTRHGDTVTFGLSQFCLSQFSPGAHLPTIPEEGCIAECAHRFVATHPNHCTAEADDGEMKLRKEVEDGNERKQKKTERGRKRRSMREKWNEDRTS